MPIVKKKLDAGQYQLKDRWFDQPVTRCEGAKPVVRGAGGGGRSEFGGRGYGSGKAKEVPQAIAKALSRRRKTCCG